jgi:biopolymer transport protein ExbD
MRVPNSRRERGLSTDQTMTPMIDVVFLLLIFFVCASVGRIRESLLSIDLSRGEVESAQAAPPEPKPPEAADIWLRLYPSPAGEKTLVEMNRREFADLESLETALRELGELSPESPVVLDIDPDVPAGDVIRVDDACRAAGFNQINYAADPERLKTNG